MEMEVDTLSVTTEQYFNDWFSKRSLRSLSYQKDILINKIPESFKNNSLPTVLAACPSAGKTKMSISFIDKYIQDNPNNKVLVLTHGTDVLRTQYHDEIVESKPDFSFSMIVKSSDLNLANNVVIALPQTLSRVKKLPHFDLLIVDESHQFYFAKDGMVEKIIKKIKPTHQLLLTGTPSPFIRRKYPIIPVTVIQLLEQNMIEDLLVEIASSTYKFDNTDYNNEYELKNDTKSETKDTNKTLDLLLEKLLHRLQSCYKNDPEKYAQYKFANNWDVTKWVKEVKNNWHKLFNTIGKTMFACKNIQQAKQVANYFQKNGINVALSTSENDIDSNEMQRFKKEKDCLVLIVVYRGILGFNYPELETVIDMTGSQNIDRIFQLMARVLRKHPDGKPKLFFKISPIYLEQYFEHIMTCVLCLCHEDYYLKFNGKNFLDLEIPVQRIKSIPGIKHSSQDNKSNNKKRTIKSIEYIGQPAIRFFKDLLHKNQDELSSYVFTKIGTIRGELILLQKNKGYWTKEMCKEDAGKFNSRMEWCKESASAYSTAVKNGWLDYCCEHMDIKLKSWSLEDLENEAKKYSSKTEWYRNSGSSYTRALKKGKIFFEKCTSHMVITREDAKNYTKKHCIEQFKEYDSKSDVAQKRPGLYRYVKSKGWLSECCAHMNNRTKWNKQMVLKSALKYKKRQEWREKDRKAYDASFNNGWYEEATKHMIKITNTYTKEQCKKDAKKCKTLKEWREKYNLTYNFAYRKGWLKELSGHMPKLEKWSKNKIENIAKKYTKLSEFKKNNSKAYSAAGSKRYNMLSYLTKKYFINTKRRTKWTEKLCVQNAKQYKTISEWIKNSSSCYLAAKKNGWFEECRKQFKIIKKTKWTKEECINDAKGCKTQREWIDKPGGAYQAAWKNNWLPECTKHMKKN